MSFEFLARMPDWLRPAQARRLRGIFLVFPLLVVASAIGLSVPAGTKTKSSLAFVGHNTSRVGADRHLDRHLDAGYVSALAAANRFLQAWQNQDHETGLIMLTDDAKEHSSADRWRPSSRLALTQRMKLRVVRSQPQPLHLPGYFVSLPSRHHNPQSAAEIPDRRGSGW